MLAFLLFPASSNYKLPLNGILHIYTISIVNDKNKAWPLIWSVIPLNIQIHFQHDWWHLFQQWSMHLQSCPIRVMHIVESFCLPSQLIIVYLLSFLSFHWRWLAYLIISLYNILGLLTEKMNLDNLNRQILSHPRKLHWTRGQKPSSENSLHLQKDTKSQRSDF